MKLTINHQENFSRTELILRTLFGWLYILIPHGVVLAFLGMVSSILTFISFWAILFTGKYPQSFFEFQVGVIRWRLRVQARIFNLSDGYPPFGMNVQDGNYTDFQMKNPQQLSRGLAVLKLLFGGLYCALPHIVLWIFRYLWTLILTFLAFWSVLFTGNYPKSWHEFNVGTFRWIIRVGLYLMYMTDDYPPFSGKELNGGNENPPAATTSAEAEPAS